MEDQKELFETKIQEIYELAVKNNFPLIVYTATVEDEDEKCTEIAHKLAINVDADKNTPAAIRITHVLVDHIADIAIALKEKELHTRSLAVAMVELIANGAE